MSDLITIIKNALSGGWPNYVGVAEVLTALCFAAIISFYIYLVYMLTNKNNLYSKDLSITLMGTTMIVAGIVVTIQSNLLISLSAGGALSIIRFRNAIKNTLDTMFLFWAIGCGIMCGAGLAVYALVLSIFITLLLIAFKYIPLAKTPMVLIINSNNINEEDKIINVLKNNTKGYKVKSRFITEKRFDLTIELQTNNEKELIREIKKIKGVLSASLLDHNSDTI